MNANTKKRREAAFMLTLLAAAGMFASLNTQALEAAGPTGCQTQYVTVNFTPTYSEGEKEYAISKVNLGGVKACAGKTAVVTLLKSTDTSTSTTPYTEASQAETKLDRNGNGSAELTPVLVSEYAGYRVGLRH